MDTMAAIRETFFQECEEQLGELEIGLEAMQEGSADSETVNAVFRAVHSIKGGAGAFKLDKLVRFAHTFETTLDLIRSEKLAPSTIVLKTMLRSADVLADLVKASRTDEPVDEARIEFADRRTERARPTPRPGSRRDEVAPSPEEEEPLDFQPVMLSIDDDPRPSTPGGSATPSNSFADSRPLSQGQRNRAVAAGTRSHGRRLDRVRRQFVAPARRPRSRRRLSHLARAIVDDRGRRRDRGTLRVRRRRLRARDRPIFIGRVGRRASVCANFRDRPRAADAEGAARRRPCRARRRRRRGGAGPRRGPIRAAPAPEAEKAQSEHGKAEAAAPTIRVDLERVDRLINLVGELVINQAMLSQRVMEAGLARSSSVAAGLGALEQLTREIQEGVMAIRAQPVKPLFQRMSRIVRELTDATGKSVRLRTEGEATEVDRTVIERLADPLTHMVRNAVDHGVETPRDSRGGGQTGAGRSEAVGGAPLGPHRH